MRPARATKRNNFLPHSYIKQKTQLEKDDGDKTGRPAPFSRNYLFISINHESF